MIKITSKTSLLQLAGIVAGALQEKQISVVLVGGAVVSIYSKNEYESKDLDFISTNTHKDITRAMKELGFTPKGKNFNHPKTEFTIEFPSGPLAIGDQAPIKAEGKIQIGTTKLKLLSPTQSVMDRLAWFYFSRDLQCLDQAIMICKNQSVNLKKVERWSESENELENYKKFLKQLKDTT